MPLMPVPGHSCTVTRATVTVTGSTGTSTSISLAVRLLKLLPIRWRRLPGRCRRPPGTEAPGAAAELPVLGHEVICLEIHACRLSDAGITGSDSESRWQLRPF
jgi:hypothetical protein